MIRLGDVGFVFTDTNLSIADDDHEKALNLALNKVSGEWDNDKLAEVLEELELSPIDIQLTGFDDLELTELQFENDIDDISDSEDILPKEVKKIICPYCGKEFDESILCWTWKHNTRFLWIIHEKVGYSQVKEYRNELLEITNKIIPVWHKPLGLNEYKKMCDNYNYIGVSCVKDRSIPSNKYGSFVGYAHQHQTKFHGLGMLRPKILDKVW